MSEPISAPLAAAVFVLARQLLPDWDGWPPSTAKMLEIAGGVGRSQCYELVNRLRDLLPTVTRASGRPPASPANSSAKQGVVEALCAYLCDHPGAICCGPDGRRTYSDAFRRFVIGLFEPEQPGAEMSVAQMAATCRIPLGTLKDWLNLEPSPAEATPLANETKASDTPESSILDTVQSTHLRELVTLWHGWEGTFKAFCDMVRTEHRLPYGETFIGNFLQATGLRSRRPRRAAEAPWSVGSFRKLFPGAQWLGDGTSLAIWWNGRPHIFNLQALLDVHTNATVGAVVADAEDEEALRKAYLLAKETAGAPPQAVSLDNKPCNHSPGAAQVFEDTTLLRTTPGRGQAKAPLEGAFGLFQQAIPPLDIQGNSAHEMARSTLELIVTAWFRGRNGRPRKDLNKQSPAEAYLSFRATPEQIEDARAYFRDLARRQEKFRLTREARLDPVRVQLLADELAELGIPDPDRRLTKSLAWYSRDAIAHGLAVIRAKQEQGTLKMDIEDAGPYLGGIIRNNHFRRELESLSVHLLEQRIRLNDLSLASLKRQAEQLQRDCSPHDLPRSLVDQALQATYAVDFRFWVQAAAQAYEALPRDRREALYKPLARRVCASFKTTRERRADLIERLATVVAAT